MSCIQGPRLRVTLAALRRSSHDAFNTANNCGLWIFPSYEAALRHKMEVIYAYYQRWADVARAIGIKYDTLVKVRSGETNLGRAALARLDNAYMMAIQMIDENIKAGRRIDEGSPHLLRWRERRKQRNVGYHLTQKAKRQGRLFRQRKKAEPTSEPTVSDSTS